MDKINNVLDCIGRNLGFGLTILPKAITVTVLVSEKQLDTIQEDIKDWIMNSNTTFVDSEEIKKDKIRVTSIETPLGKINFILNEK